MHWTAKIGIILNAKQITGEYSSGIAKRIVRIVQFDSKALAAGNYFECQTLGDE